MAFRGIHVLSTLLTVLPLLGCGTPFSTTGAGGSGGTNNSTSSTTAGGGDGGDGAGGAGQCPADAVCVPPDWTAAAAFVSSQQAAVPGCTAQLPIEIAFAMHGLKSPTIECPCNCSSSGSVGCEGGQAEYGSSCATLVGNVSLICSTANIGAIQFDTLPSPSADSCRPVVGAPVKPALEWTSYIRLCGSSAPADACSEGNCAPLQSPYGEPRCVTRPGDHSCPAPFNNRMVAFTNVADNRSCTACGCDPSCAASYVQLYNMGACLPGDESGIVQPGGCQQASAQSAKLVRLGGCAKTGGEPVIDVVPSEPVTICCAEN